MADQVIDRLVIFGVAGAYGIGCSPTFDVDSRELVISPGLFCCPTPPELGGGLEEEFVFPGGTVTLPAEATAVWVSWRRDGAARVPAIVVNVGKGIDTVTYFPAHLVYLYGASWDEVDRLSRPAHILKHFRIGPAEIRDWKHTTWGAPPTDLEQFRGENAEVHIQAEMPEAVKATLEREAIAVEARKALTLLLRIPDDQWTDVEMRAIILNIAKSDPSLELPDSLLTLVA